MHSPSSEATMEQIEKTKVAKEFGSWPVSDTQADHINNVKAGFDHLLNQIETITPNYNGRYLAIVKTKLEEACMFAVKGVSVPQGN